MDTVIIDEEKKHRCVKCNSTQVYIRFLTKQKVCRACGFIQQLDSPEFKKER